MRIHNGLATSSDLVDLSANEQHNHFSRLIQAMSNKSEDKAPSLSPYFLVTGKYSNFTWIRVMFAQVMVIIRNQDDLRKMSKIAPNGYNRIVACWNSPLIRERLHSFFSVTYDTHQSKKLSTQNSTHRNKQTSKV